MLPRLVMLLARKRVAIHRFLVKLFARPPSLLKTKTRTALQARFNSNLDAEGSTGIITTRRTRRRTTIGASQARP
jgi:hypothetical protein